VPYRPFSIISQRCSRLCTADAFAPFPRALQCTAALFGCYMALSMLPLPGKAASDTSRAGLALCVPQDSARAAKGGQDAGRAAENTAKAHAAAALYLALLQLPGARSHIFNEFTFRSVAQTIALVVAAPQAGARGKKRRREVPAVAGRAQREGMRKSARVTNSSSQTPADVDHDDDDDDDEDNNDYDDAEHGAGEDSATSAGAKGAGGQPPHGIDVLRLAKLLAENVSLQTVPQAHEQLARVAVETALSLPNNSAEAEMAWGSARALSRPLHGPGAGKTVLKQLLPGVLRPSAPAAAVKAVVAFVDSCLAELPPAPLPSAATFAVPAPPTAVAPAGGGLAATQGGKEVADESGDAKAAGAAAAAATEVNAHAEAACKPEATFEDAIIILCHQLCVRVGDRAPTRVQVTCSAVALALVWSYSTLVYLTLVLCGPATPALLLLCATLNP
jgi:hypothetical protein